MKKGAIWKMKKGRGMEKVGERGKAKCLKKHANLEYRVSLPHVFCKVSPRAL